MKTPRLPAPNPVASRLSVLVLLGLAVSLHAAPMRISQLVGLRDGMLGGAGEGWVGTSGMLTITNTYSSLDGVPLGLFPSAGTRALLAASTTLNARNTYHHFAALGQFPQSVPVDLYYSFLFRFNETTNMSSVSSNMVALVTRQNGSTPEHFNLHALTNAAGRIILGLVKSTQTGVTAGVPVYAADKPVNRGETFFVVLRQRIVAGPDNDPISLWINPPPATFGASEVNVPPPDATATIGFEDQSTTGPGRFYIFAGVSADFDELRIATNSWADVTPPTWVCIPAAFTSHPTNVTVNEGIAARFSVATDSSSPVYQWQVSTNGGATWNNVTGGIGGITASYQTAPLGVGASGHRYRCVITVSCGGGSSTTSSVAVVTVNPVTPTPLGVIVDDRFADLTRDVGPVGVSNAVWFASSTPSLSGGWDGHLVGAAAPASSRLWIAYFTENPAQPVHLAVGRTLRATLHFRASNIVTNGGNSMRFGLFNYADGGGRVLGDNFSSGSAGNGQNVLGYMLGLNWGVNFAAEFPQILFVRTAISDPSLMGSTGTYRELGEGPAGGGFTGAAAFANDIPYALELAVTRLTATSVRFAASLTGGGTNYTTTAVDTVYAYPRFDAFAIRPASLETTADSITIERFRVEVVPAAPAPEPVSVSVSGGNVTLTWSNPAFTLQAAPEVTGVFTNVPGAVSPHVVPATGSRGFYRLFWSP